MYIGQYKGVYLPSHHKANKDGGVYEHIVIAEQKLGRPLKDLEVVHHIDGDKDNNAPDNLAVFATKSDHTSYHQRKDAPIVIDSEGVWHCTPYGIGNCVQCGAVLSRPKVTLCKRCAARKRGLENRKFNVTKDELKLLIVQYPMTKIASMYSVSNNAIKKRCKSYGLPCTRKDIMLLKSELNIPTT